jgi:hypothetical protein
MQIAAWRGRLLLAGLYCEDADLPRLLGMKFRDWRSELAKVYEVAPQPGSPDTRDGAIGCADRPG